MKLVDEKDGIVGYMSEVAREGDVDAARRGWTESAGE